MEEKGNKYLAISAVIGFTSLGLAMLSEFFVWMVGSNSATSQIPSIAGCVIIFTCLLLILGGLYPHRLPYFKQRYQQKLELDALVVTYLLVFLIGLFITCITNLFPMSYMTWDSFIGWYISAIGVVLLMFRLISYRKREQNPVKLQIYNRILKYAKYFVIGMVVIALVAAVTLLIIAGGPRPWN
ncbi:hypothetical protein ACFLVP_02190 [Chloroflexota bacterium]